MVELEVAGVNYLSRWSFNDHSHGVGNGVSHGKEFYFESAEPDGLVFLHDFISKGGT